MLVPVGYIFTNELLQTKSFFSFLQKTLCGLIHKVKKCFSSNLELIEIKLYEALPNGKK